MAEVQEMTQGTNWLRSIFVIGWCWGSFSLKSVTCLSLSLWNWACQEGRLVLTLEPASYTCILLFWLEDCYFCEKPIVSHSPLTCLSHPKWSPLCHCSPYNSSKLKVSFPNNRLWSLWRWACVLLQSSSMLLCLALVTPFYTTAVCSILSANAEADDSKSCLCKWTITICPAQAQTHRLITYLSVNNSKHYHLWVYQIKLEHTGVSKSEKQDPWNYWTHQVNECCHPLTWDTQSANPPWDWHGCLMTSIVSISRPNTSLGEESIHVFGLLLLCSIVTLVDWLFVVFFLLGLGFKRRALPCKADTLTLEAHH
jgi:hypothetical protein